VVPVRYDLHLVPDLEKATFTGSVRVRLEVREPVSEIRCNAAELVIHEALLVAIDGEGEPAGDQLAAAVALDADAEQAIFTLDCEVPPGHYALDLAFDGVLNDQLRGFYRSTYTDDDGTEHVIATTQFEATDARRAFPCWDEPDRKAVFSIRLDVPAGLAAVSNWPEVESEQLEGGGRRVRFGDTIPMSTYLVAFVVGRLETSDTIDVDGVAVRVVHRPGQAHLAGFALEVARHALPFFADWFAIPYPGPKLDLIGIPDFASGAMENLGAVTFREAELLVDPAGASQPELEAVASTIQHEIAHMWFGDLVTMRWWNGIWLNEAFATYMSLVCLDDFRPQWRAWDSFGPMRAAALEIDSLHSTRPIEYPVHRPEEAEGMFDALTYEKGAAVLRMLERFVGMQRFRDGVRSYLAAHLYGNTETTDLWDAIEDAAESEPVRSMMDSWIFQGGFPLVEVGDDGAHVRLSATPFVRLPGEEQGASGIGRDWLVPVILARREGPPERDDLTTSRVVLGSSQVTPSLGGDPEAPVVANAGGHGFYRVRYDDRLFGRVAGHLDRLVPLERYCLVSDTWVCAHSGVVPLERFFDLAGRLGAETDPSVWSVVTGALDKLDRVVTADDREAFRAYTSSLLAPQLERLGWEAAAGEDELTENLRASVVRRLGLLAEDRSVIEECTWRYGADRQGSPISPGLAGAVLAVVSRFGGSKELEELVDALRHAGDPQQERRLQDALGQVADPALAEHVQQLTLSEIRSQDGPYVLRFLLVNRHVQASTWAFVTSHWDEMLERFPRSTIPGMLRGLVALDAVSADGSAPLADSAHAFVEAHPLDGRERLIEQHLEILDVNVAFARRARAGLGELLRRT
jgi:puromycin-sensitive aminopeptidase